eukprot:TRINITY_DN6651_c0_g1_i1.p1 TRINITY_DN6651_c0_g1~~TRINITY_DN6651_c0_g1_i1.p1  ORF type:complete len:117 (-),score=6.61 TRINITY_DN6651_c0_g1_i1:40-390(-)
MLGRVRMGAMLATARTAPKLPVTSFGVRWGGSHHHVELPSDPNDIYDNVENTFELPSQLNWYSARLLMTFALLYWILSYRDKAMGVLDFITWREEQWNCETYVHINAKGCISKYCW